MIFQLESIPGYLKKLHKKEAYGIGFDMGGIFSIDLGETLNYNWMGKLVLELVSIIFRDPPSLVK